MANTGSGGLGGSVTPDLVVLGKEYGQDSA